MKQITITIPNNYELKQDGNTYTIVEKEKKLTYEDVAKNLFKHKVTLYITSAGSITPFFCNDSFNNDNNCTSEKQAEKLLAINKLMNVAKYLNGDWQFDWTSINENKYFVTINCSEIYIEETLINHGAIYFKSRKLAEKAIDILGEETIKLALCTDY